MNLCWIKEKIPSQQRLPQGTLRPCIYFPHWRQCSTARWSLVSTKPDGL